MALSLLPQRAAHPSRRHDTPHSRILVMSLLVLVMCTNPACCDWSLVPLSLDAPVRSAAAELLPPHQPARLRSRSSEANVAHGATIHRVHRLDFDLQFCWPIFSDSQRFPVFLRANGSVWSSPWPAPSHFLYFIGQGLRHHGSATSA